MKIATWNVNSLKIRLPQLLDWLKSNEPDVVCLQETKCEDAAFPTLEFEAAGYASACSGQKAYNGVALLARRPLQLADVVHGNPRRADDQKRLISATCDGVRVVCAYFPNGQSVGSDKYRYKLEWIESLRAWLADEIGQHRLLALAGDLNIAPEPRDVYDPQVWEGQVLFSEPERAAFRDLLALGLHDAFRLFPQADKSYSWWDYRMLAFRRNRGLRIDHILVSESLAPLCRACSVVRELRGLERPSDHAPVIADFTLPPEQTAPAADASAPALP